MRVRSDGAHCTERSEINGLPVPDNTISIVRRASLCLTSCYSTGGQTQHRCCCPRANNVKNIDGALRPLESTSVTSQNCISVGLTVFTARCYASAVLAMAVCLSVRPSQVGVLLKQLNESSWFLACELPSTRPTLC